MPKPMSSRAIIFGLLICSPILAAPAETAEKAPEPNVIRIGILKSVFHGVPSALFRLISQPLKVLMKTQTGIDGEIFLVDDPATLARLLKKNEVQLGVMHGFELGWARKHNEELKPLVVAIRKNVHLHACLVVHKDSNINACGSLKGKSIAIPRKCRAHCRLYFERRCPDAATITKEFFASVTNPSQPESALDNVVDGCLDAALVEKEALESFAVAKPKRRAELRVLQESEPFPAGVVVYHPGHLTDSTLAKFRVGMKDATKSDKGRRLLRTCRLTQFLDVPADFEAVLEAIVKAYPPSQ